MNRRPLNEKQSERQALTLALVLAVTAKTKAHSQQAVLLAGSIAGRMQPLDVAHCQTEAKRIMDTTFKGE